MAFKKVSDEIRKKLSIANSKPRPWQKNRITDEVRKKISKSLTGFKRSDENRKNMAKARKGSKSHLWKGGISPINEAIRKTLEYRLWRTAVFERDNYTCIWCSKRGGRLVADHIKTFSLILVENNIKTLEQAINCKELWNINNGRTLCEECHEKTDTYGSKTNHF